MTVPFDTDLYCLDDYAAYFPRSEEFLKKYRFFSMKTGRMAEPRPVSASEFLSERELIQSVRDDFCDSRYVTSKIVDFFCKFHSSSVVQLDVGSYLGTYAIEQALLAIYRQMRMEIFAFEPGPIFSALEGNIDINGLGGYISPVNAAVSDEVGEITFDYVPGWLIGGAIGGYGGANEKLVSIPCKATTIDAFLEQRFGASISGKSLIIKLDCQGLEPKVYEGSANLVQSGVPLVFLSEFLCWSYEHFKAPYRKFLESFHVIDAKNVCFRQHNYPYYPDQASFEAHVSKLAAGDTPWTDLILIPRGLKNAEKLLDAIVSP